MKTWNTHKLNSSNPAQGAMGYDAPDYGQASSLSMF